jgi:8-amino-7-oxononanoate synthase
MTSLDKYAADKLQALDASDLRRRLVTTEIVDDRQARRDNRRLTVFCSNDYLALSQHPEVKARAADALERYGVGSGASRLVTGNHPLFADLEARLAALKQTDACVVFGSGYLANLGIVPTLAGPEDLILADELSHACLLAGTQLSGAESHLFRHNDLDHLGELLDRHRAGHRHCLILTDGVFSMDGDLAPLPDLAELAETHDAWLMSDDAHGIGVLGGGRGSSFAGGQK